MTIFLETVFMNSKLELTKSEVVRRLSSRLVHLCLLTTTIFGLVACGGSTNNNNGTVLSFIGFFPSDSDGDCAGAGLTGATVPMSDVVGTENPGSTGGVIVSAGILNNLVGQTVRLTRIDMDYFVPGATAQPPSTFTPFPLLLGPAQGAEGGVETSLPDGFSQLGNCSVSQFMLITPEVSAWINLNRGSLPPPPFAMYVTTSVVGQSSAGDVLYSDQATLILNITPDVVIPPTEGEETEGEL